MSSGTEEAKRAVRTAVGDIRNALFDEDAAATLLILAKIIGNVLKRPSSEKVRSLRKANAKIRERIIRVPGAVGVLRAVGFSDAGECLQLNVEGIDGHILAQKLAGALEVLRVVAFEVGVADDVLPKIPETLPAMFAADAPAPAPPTNFDVFASKVDRVVPQPRGGRSATEQRVSILKKKADKLLEEAGLPDRRTRIRLKGQQDASRAPRGVEGSSSGPSDASIVARSLKARMEKQKLNAQLRTKAQRDLTQLQSKRVYTETCIRVQFPRPHDSIILESYFNPNERIEAVLDVIRKSLVPAFSDAPFELYQTPPRRVLQPNSTLRDEKLVPSAVVRLSWQENAPSAQSPLGIFQSSIFGDQNASFAFPSSVALDEEFEKKKQKEASGAVGRASSSSSTGKKKKPKWFKL